MEGLIKWLKENIGDDIQIITPQFERDGELEYKYKPKTKKEFLAFIEKAPWKILKGCGFGKWDTMNNLIKENKGTSVVHVPVIDSQGKTRTKTTFIVGSDNVPVNLLNVDEDIILFPGEWYDVIPDGFMVTGLYGESYPFKKGDSDDDIRFGCLPYGIRRPIT